MAEATNDEQNNNLMFFDSQEHDDWIRETQEQVNKKIISSSFLQEKEELINEALNSHPVYKNICNTLDRLALDTSIPNTMTSRFFHDTIIEQYMQIDAISDTAIGNTTVPVIDITVLDKIIQSATKSIDTVAFTEAGYIDKVQTDINLNQINGQSLEEYFTEEKQEIMEFNDFIKDELFPGMTNEDLKPIIQDIIGGMSPKEAKETINIFKAHIRIDNQVSEISKSNKKWDDYDNQNAFDKAYHDRLVALYPDHPIVKAAKEKGMTLHYDEFMRSEGDYDAAKYISDFIVARKAGDEEAQIENMNKFLALAERGNSRALRIMDYAVIDIDKDFVYDSRCAHPKMQDIKHITLDTFAETVIPNVYRLYDQANAHYVLDDLMESVLYAKYGENFEDLLEFPPKDLNFDKLEFKQKQDILIALARAGMADKIFEGSKDPSNIQELKKHAIDLIRDDNISIDGKSLVSPDGKDIDVDTILEYLNRYRAKDEKLSKENILGKDKFFSYTDDTKNSMKISKMWFKSKSRTKDMSKERSVMVGTNRHNFAHRRTSKEQEKRRDRIKETTINAIFQGGYKGIEIEKYIDANFDLENRDQTDKYDVQRLFIEALRRSAIGKSGFDILKSKDEKFSIQLNRDDPAVQLFKQLKNSGYTYVLDDIATIIDEQKKSSKEILDEDYKDKRESEKFTFEIDLNKVKEADQNFSELHGNGLGRWRYLSDMMAEFELAAERGQVKDVEFDKKYGESIEVFFAFTDEVMPKIRDGYYQKQEWGEDYQSYQMFIDTVVDEMKEQLKTLPPEVLMSDRFLDAVRMDDGEIQSDIKKGLRPELKEGRERALRGDFGNKDFVTTKNGHSVLKENAYKKPGPVEFFKYRARGLGNLLAYGLASDNTNNNNMELSKVEKYFPTFMKMARKSGLGRLAKKIIKARRRDVENVENSGFHVEDSEKVHIETPEEKYEFALEKIKEYRKNQAERDGKRAMRGRFWADKKPKEIIEAEEFVKVYREGERRKEQIRQAVNGQQEEKTSTTMQLVDSEDFSALNAAFNMEGSLALGHEETAKMYMKSIVDSAKAGNKVALFMLGKSANGQGDINITSLEEMKMVVSSQKEKLVRSYNENLVLESLTSELVRSDGQIRSYDASIMRPNEKDNLLILIARGMTAENEDIRNRTKELAKNVEFNGHPLIQNGSINMQELLEEVNHNRAQKISEETLYPKDKFFSSKQTSLIRTETMWKALNAAEATARKEQSIQVSIVDIGANGIIEQTPIRGMEEEQRKQQTGSAR